MLSRNARKDEAPRGDRSPADGALSVVGAGMRIVGDCTMSGALRVEGIVTGGVRADRLEIVGDGRVEGDVSGEGDGDARAGQVVVDGHVGGSVRAERVEVHANGVVEGGVVSGEAVIRGRVSEGVVASGRLLIAGTGFIEGDVRAGRLAVEEGGQVNGSIRMEAQRASGPTRSGSKGGAANGDGAGAESASARSSAA